MLFFSRSSVSPAVPGEIYVSERQQGARFGLATAVAELNDAAAKRADGLEDVFSSNRAGGAGAQDIWIVTRSTIGYPWSAPTNNGGGRDTAAAESPPSLSQDSSQLLFGRAPGPEGSSDLHHQTAARFRNGTEDDTGEQPPGTKR